MQPTSLMAARKRALSSLTNGGSKLIWKAYAIALQAYLTTQDDLDNSSKAIFVASPGLFDIPAGEFAPREITNEHLFRRADVLQDTRSPFYMSDGDSYFDSRRRYLQSVYDDPETHSNVIGSIPKLRYEVQTAQDRTAEAYLRDLNLYHKSKAVVGSRLMDFEAWSKRFGTYFAWAKAEQKRLESEYTLISAKTSSSVGLALAAFHLAQEKSILRLGPLYSINGVDRRVDSWVEANDGGREEVTLDLNLVGAQKTPWASLGLPNLDSNPLYNAHNTDIKVKLSLVAGGMQAFDVDRGFWDVSAAARSQLGSATGTDSHPTRLMKITRILLGYNVKIKLTAADDMTNPLPSALLDMGGAEKNILGIPANKLDDDDEQAIVASAPSGFPAVLAVLGREI